MGKSLLENAALTAAFSIGLWKLKALGLLIYSVEPLHMLKSATKCAKMRQIVREQMTEWNYNLDEMPKIEGNEYLVTLENGQVHIYRVSLYKFDSKVIAWMPLPEPARKKSIFVSTNQVQKNVLKLMETLCLPSAQQNKPLTLTSAHSVERRVQPMPDNNEVIDFPKIKSPFIRKDINGHYVCTPEIEPGYEWVFTEPGVRAVDKLHGTNLCVIIQDGIIKAVDNRDTRIFDMPCLKTNATARDYRFLEGILFALEKGYLPDNGRVYGELIGPTINGNLHQVDRHQFIPFSYLKSKCFWKSWSRGDYSKDFSSISYWFRHLNSLYTKRVTDQVILGEGLIFYSQDGKMAKLRRDMFDWFYEETPEIQSDTD